jgi:hypothetical protein
MTTKLEKPVRREVLIAREPWVVTIAGEGLKLVRKGHRKGIELDWEGLVSGDAALAASLNASMRAGIRQRRTAVPAPARSSAVKTRRAARPRSKR